MPLTIPIPDFAAMATADLHAWEFRVYEQADVADPTLKEAELAQIVGEDVARRYYDERGRRIDEACISQINTEIDLLVQERDAAAGRVAAGKSGAYHFPRYRPAGCD